ncbi:MAG: NAD-dependent epimerase/dehydratase family protein [Xanthomonadales bacterium]|nr:NAD-dependent epimerase/dehydratase family protein [Xanthomonadales bacterium]
MSTVLVTGGSGFLGLALCQALRERGHEVRSIQRSHSVALEQMGVAQTLAPIDDADAVTAAAAGCEVVFHVAAKAGAWGPRAEYERANVEGTRAVLQACREHGVSQLIHTSTPSVAHGGGDLAGVDESVPYPEHYAAPYPATKAVAEREVLAANGPQLATVALRPHLIWGPGDNHLLPRMIERARAGRLAFIGAGDKLIDVTYIDNAVEAHLRAWAHLWPGSSCAGRAYFISDGQPIALKAMVNHLLGCAGVAPVHRHVPLPLARLLAPLVEFAWRSLRLRGEPMLTRFLVEQFSTAHWYDISAARRDLGYTAAVTLEQGLARLTEQLTQSGADTRPTALG